MHAHSFSNFLVCIRISVCVTHIQIRDQVHLLTDSLILREMAEELQRGFSGGGGGGGGGGGKPVLTKQFSEEVLIDEEEGDHSFQSVLK